MGRSEFSPGRSPGKPRKKRPQVLEGRLTLLQPSPRASVIPSAAEGPAFLFKGWELHTPTRFHRASICPDERRAPEESSRSRGCHSEPAAFWRCEESAFFSWPSSARSLRPRLHASRRLCTAKINNSGQSNTRNPTSSESRLGVKHTWLIYLLCISRLGITIPGHELGTYAKPTRFTVASLGSTSSRAWDAVERPIQR